MTGFVGQLGGSRWVCRDLYSESGKRGTGETEKRGRGETENLTPRHVGTNLFAYRPVKTGPTLEHLHIVLKVGHIAKLCEKALKEPSTFMEDCLRNVREPLPRHPDLQLLENRFPQHRFSVHRFPVSPHRRFTSFQLFHSLI